MHGKGWRETAAGGMASLVLVVFAMGGSAGAAVRPRFVVPSTTDVQGILPLDVQRGDFNGDGVTDAAVANQGPDVFHGGIAVALGKGNGTFGTEVNNPLGGNEGACELAVGDFTGDAKDDVAAVACTTGGPFNIFVMKSNGDGTLVETAQLTNSQKGQLVSADFNEDGKADLAFSSNGAAEVRVYFGKGDGTFKVPTLYSPDFDSYDFKTADVNNDDHADLVGASGGPPWVMLNQGSGTFGSQIFSFSQDLNGIGVDLADFDEDGNLDIADVDASGGHVYIGLGDGQGHFNPTAQFGDLGRQVNYVAAGDFDGDGHADVDATSEANTSVLITGEGHGAFRQPVWFVTGALDVTAADLNGDARMDLLSFSQDPGRLYSALGNKRGFAAPRLWHTDALGTMREGDVNGDGKRDLVMSGIVVHDGVIQSLVTTHLGKGNGKFGPPIVSNVREELAASGIGDIRLGDLNNDGKLDVVGGFTNFQFSPNNLFWMLGKGDGRFGKPTLSGTGDVDADVESLALAEVTGDQHLDIVAHTRTLISVKPGNGTGGFGAPILSGSSGIDQSSTLVGDFTGDGKPDVVVSIVTGSEDFSSSDIKLNKGNGSGTFSLIQTVHIDTNVGQGVTADLGGDDAPDAAFVGGAGSDGGRAGLWVFIDAGGTLDGGTLYQNKGFSGLVAADFDGDGDVDLANDAIVVAANAGDGTFADFQVLPASGTVGVAGDFTGDGKPDLIGGSPLFPSQFALYVNSSK
jgi:hypothetical protein